MYIHMLIYTVVSYKGNVKNKPFTISVLLDYKNVNYDNRCMHTYVHMH